MARPKEFEQDEALGAAIGVFREHGFEGTSAGMLTAAMRIGRQSLYDTFGDKWRLYCRALERYSADEVATHLEALARGPRAADGLATMMERIVAEARRPCLGIGSIAEFGCSRPELLAIREKAGRALHEGLVRCIRAAQAEGDVAAGLDPDEAALYLVANIGGIRLAARSGTDEATLQGLGRLALRALR
jgi:AcrR family transcriptional regulator